MAETAVAGAFECDGLIGVPSYHYDPAFAQVAVRAIEELKPSVVALELPAGVEEELAWAASCWPGPVVCDSGSALFPFVPGDSIFEAYRQATSAGIRIALIDLACDLGNARPGRQRPPAVLPGQEWMIRAPQLFLEATDAALASARPVAPEHLAREAYMAAEIIRLLREGGRVLWVGGMAHWTRLQSRIRTNDFGGPAVPLEKHSIFVRMRLAASALQRMTGRLPWLVESYASDPRAYDEAAAIRQLALDAVKKHPDNDVVLVTGGKAAEHLDQAVADERATPMDVARTLLYARNLAATGGVRERPDFAELLTSAAATIGPRYAGRLYTLAMQERSSPSALAYDPLEWEVVKGHEQFRSGNKIVSSRPWWDPQGGLVVSMAEVKRRARNELYKDLPPTKKGGKDYWECDPRDEEAYVSFVEYLLRRASYTNPDEAKAVPFRSGLRDGIDVRQTLRNWSTGTLYVREEQRDRLKFTNGAIDWTNLSEHSDILAGRTPGGWIDPSLIQLGSCSRDTGGAEILSRDPFCQVDTRDLSLLTLDLPTSRRASAAEGETFYSRVIQRLVSLRGSEDNLYAWLDIMFAFCAGKPFAYYSRYVPSPRIHGIAWKHDVRVVHFPFQRLPANLVNRHKSFRFLAFTRAQWREFQRRRSAAGGTWTAG